MGRRRADVRREEILRAAAEVIADKGFARTRAADVAAVLGVSTALVFYHFESKERLLSEAFAYAAQRDLDRLSRAVTGRGTFTDKLRAAMRLYAPVGAAPGWTLDIDAWAESLRTDEIRQAARDLGLRWRAAIEHVLREGLAAGEFTCADPAGSAVRITAMLDGLAVATQVRHSTTRSSAARWAADYAAREVGVSADRLLAPSARR